MTLAVPDFGKSHVLYLEESNDNAENLSLADFIQTRNVPLLERVTPFSNYYRENIRSKTALYSREIVGPCQNRSKVKDLVSGQEREMVMLGSNNYLGLSTHPKVRAAAVRAIHEYGAGMGGPPLLNGMSSLHRELERRLVQLKRGHYSPDQPDQYDAMLFASGFQANIGWVAGLMREGDVLLYDEFSHASLFDGITLAGARTQAFRFHHNSVEHLKLLLMRFSKKNCEGQVYVAVEGVYSMDGDIALLPEIARLCEQFGAVLVVDDAHGVGVLGKKGGGVTEHFGLQQQVDLSLGTFSKTFGATGGFIVARKEIIDYLRFFSRSYMFSAHLPPSTAATVLACLDVFEEEPQLIAQLHQNALYLSQGLESEGFHIQHETAILPIFIPFDIDIRRVNRRFDEEGIFLNSIEYPAVPKRLQRLRASVMATHTHEDLDLAISTFRKIKKEFAL